LKTKLTIGPEELKKEKDIVVALCTRLTEWTRDTVRPGTGAIPDMRKYIKEMGPKPDNASPGMSEFAELFAALLGNFEHELELYIDAGDRGDEGSIGREDAIRVYRVARLLVAYGSGEGDCVTIWVKA
jgi:hypothetical protein